MGNLEKAGVLVVVALLAMILVITVLNPPAEVPQNRTESPQLSGTAPRVDAPLTPPNVVPNQPVNPLDAGLTPINDPLRNQNPESRPVTPGTIRPEPVSTLTPPPSPYVAEPEFEMVKVKLTQGDSLYKIAAKRYGARRAAEGVKAIEAANPGLNPAKLRLGSEIEIPKALPNVVKSERMVSSDGNLDERLATDTSPPKTPTRAPSPKKAASTPKRQPLPFEGG